MNHLFIYHIVVDLPWFSLLILLLGTKVVFWDLRDSFLFGLYRGNVEDARLDSILSHVDTVR